MVWKVLFKWNKQIVIDKTKDLASAHSICKWIGLEIDGSTVGNRHNTGEAYTHKTFFRMQEIPYGEPLQSSLFQSCKRISNYFKGCDHYCSWVSLSPFPHVIQARLISRIQLPVVNRKVCWFLPTGTSQTINGEHHCCVVCLHLFPWRRPLSS